MEISGPNLLSYRCKLLIANQIIHSLSHLKVPCCILVGDGYSCHQVSSQVAHVVTLIVNHLHTINPSPLTLGVPHLKENCQPVLRTLSAIQTSSVSNSAKVPDDEATTSFIFPFSYNSYFTAFCSKSISMPIT